MKELKIIGISLLTLVIVFLLFSITTLQKNNTPDIPMPWESVTINNKVKIFNLTLGESTLKNAMQIFGSEANVSLFKEKDKNSSLEVYFKNTKIGGFSAKIILTLITNNKTLGLLNQNIKDYKSLPSGNEKVDFSNFANNMLLNNKIKNLSFIPRLTLTDDDIINRFGSPAIKQDNLWSYPEKGLDIVKNGELTIFEYSNKYNY